MLFKLLALVVLTALVEARLHLAFDGLLQIPPSFAKDGTWLYPAHHPDHNTFSIEHLTPSLNKDLYFTQEGHRRKFYP